MFPTIALNTAGQLHPTVMFLQHLIQASMLLILQRTPRLLSVRADLKSWLSYGSMFITMRSSIMSYVLSRRGPFNMLLHNRRKIFISISQVTID